MLNQYEVKPDKEATKQSNETKYLEVLQEFTRLVKVMTEFLEKAATVREDLERLRVALGKASLKPDSEKSDASGPGSSQGYPKV